MTYERLYGAYTPVSYERPRCNDERCYVQQLDGVTS